MIKLTNSCLSSARQLRITLSESRLLSASAWIN